MPYLKRKQIGPKINNKTFAGLVAFLAIIMVVWLVGYFTGIDEGKTRNPNTVMQNEPTEKVKVEESLPQLPQLPQVSEKSASNKLPQLPELP